MASNYEENSLKEKTAKRLNKIFKKMACKDPKKAIHTTALSSAMIVAALPIGIDAWALRLCECLMLMSIYSHYNIKLSQSAAESLLTAAFAQAVGEAAAYTALEAADAAAILTGGTRLAICIPIAAGLIEAVGWTTIKYIEGDGAAKAAIRAMEVIGGASDVKRLANTVSNTAIAETSNSLAGNNNSNSISFRGTVYTAADLDDAGKVVEKAERKVKQYRGFLESDQRFGRDTLINTRKLEYAQEELEKALNLYNKIKAAL